MSGFIKKRAPRDFASLFNRASAAPGRKGRREGGATMQPTGLIDFICVYSARLKINDALLRIGIPLGD